MDIGNVFGGDSLKAADLQGREHNVVISAVDMKKFDNGNKLVLSFQGRKKTLVRRTPDASPMPTATIPTTGSAKRSSFTLISWTSKASL